MFSFLQEQKAKSTSCLDDKAFLLLLDKGLFQIRVQDPNTQVPRDSPATTSSVADHLALVGKSISSYLVVDRRVQGTIFSRTSPGRRNAPRAKSPSSSFQRRPWAPKRDFRPRSQSPGRHNGYPRANFGTKSRTPYNNGNRPTSMEVDVLTDLLATARDRRPDGQGPSQGNSSR